jgi:hypothetical protein
MARQAWRRAAGPDVAWPGAARHGKTRQAWHGEGWRDKTRRDNARQALQSSSSWLGGAWQASRGWAWLG